MESDGKEQVGLCIPQGPAERGQQKASLQVAKETWLYCFFLKTKQKGYCILIYSLNTQLNH